MDRFATGAGEMRDVTAGMTTKKVPGDRDQVVPEHLGATTGEKIRKPGSA